MATARAIRQAYDLRFAELGLNLSEASLLAYVEESGALTQTRLAERLGIVEKTVKNVLMSVFTKCKVRNRVELALRAFNAPIPNLSNRRRKRQT